MPRDEELAAAQIRDDVDARIALREDCQLRDTLNVLSARLGVPRVRHIKGVVKSAQEALMLHADPVLVDTEDLFIHPVFRDAIMIVQPRLCSPADVKGGVGMFAAPLHDFCYLVPVRDALELHLLDGRPRNDEPVVFFMPHLGECTVELRKIVARGV